MRRIRNRKRKPVRRGRLRWRRDRSHRGSRRRRQSRSRGYPGRPGAAAGKKKKKSRVQVGLNTLRSEGVEAFGAYIEAEIGKTELLHNLRGRLLRAEDLGGSKDPALRVVEERMQGLAITAAPQAAAPMPGYALEPPVRAPVKSELTGKENNLFEYCFANDVRKFRRLLRFGKVDINMGSEVGTLLSWLPIGAKRTLSASCCQSAALMSTWLIAWELRRFTMRSRRDIRT